MDIRLSDDDRVGPARKRQPAAKGGKAKASRGRSELVAEDRQPKRGTRRKRKKLTLVGVMLKLVSWLFILGIWGGVAAAGIVVYYGMQLPSSSEWAVPDRPANIRILAADGALISNRGKTGGEAVSLRELPHYVPAAVLAIEDRRFYDHFGVDVIGIARALVGNLSEGRITGGGSTITQQLAKNLFLSPDQNLGRKVQEALLSLWLEQNYTKDQILELYLNRVFFGHNSTGIEAAARTYFGKSARNLSLGEAALLAGSLQAPSRLNPRTNPEASATRARLVLNAMAEEGYISPAEAQAAALNGQSDIPTRVAGAESYVADWVESLMQAYVGDLTQDVVVYTTINWDLQKQAEFLVKEMVRTEGQAKSFSQGALVAMDVDGTVRAVVGGADYAQSQFNRAVTARRQPGSAFKPFVYLAGLEHGFTPDSTAEDVPFTYEGWSPNNATDKYYGVVALRDALANSLNTIAARLAIAVGPATVVETAMRMGISSPMQPVPSIALGTSEMSLLELTAAYAPFANGGQGVIAHVITRIETADGKLLYEDQAAGPGQVVAPENVAMMNDMLSTALEIGTGRRAHLDGWPIAGKTGTSQKARDAVFVGYTARMVAGVWLGNDDDKPTQLSGGSAPVELWSQFMTKAHAGYTVAELPGAYQRLDVAPLQPAPAPEQVQQQQATRRGNLLDAISNMFSN